MPSPQALSPSSKGLRCQAAAASSLGGGDTHDAWAQGRWHRAGVWGIGVSWQRGGRSPVTVPPPLQRGRAGVVAPPQGCTSPLPPSPPVPVRHQRAKAGVGVSLFNSVQGGGGDHCRVPGPPCPGSSTMAGAMPGPAPAGTERQGGSRGAPGTPQKPPGAGGSGARGVGPPLSVASGVFLRPAPENLGLVLELTGQILPQHPLGVWAVQQQQQVLQHCRHRERGGVRAGTPFCRVPPCRDAHLGQHGWWAPSAGWR